FDGDVESGVVDAVVQGRLRDAGCGILDHDHVEKLGGPAGQDLHLFLLHDHGGQHLAGLGLEEERPLSGQAERADDGAIRCGVVVQSCDSFSLVQTLTCDSGLGYIWVMITHPREALAAFLEAVREPYAASAHRTGDQDSRVEAAYMALADAFEIYEDAIYTAFDEVTPFELFDDVEDAKDDDDEFVLDDDEDD